jgi:hypothetical protein
MNGPIHSPSPLGARQWGMLTSSSNEETWIESIKGTRSEKETYRTSSQRKAYDRLVQIAKIRPESVYANISPRTRAVLITGPAGAGKTAIVQAYSRLGGLPMLSLLASAWVPMGALQPPTILAIRDFVRSNPKGGLVYIDEVDKLCPAGSEARQSSWALGCLGEAISLLDCDARLISLGWSENELLRFRRSYRIVASGAWQHVAAKVRAASKRGALGFGAGDHALGYGEALGQDDAIPEEVRFRFFSETVQVDLPTREDFRVGIGQIHDELEYHVSITDVLLAEAVNSRLGVRWLESYLARLLLLLEVEEAEHDDHPKAEEPPVRHLSRAEYTHVHGRMADWAISLRVALTRYEVALTVALDRPSSSQAICELIRDGWQEHPALLEYVRELGEALVPLESGRLHSNRTYSLLQGLSFATKWALQKQAPGLQHAGLLNQTVIVRELCSRIESVMGSLIEATIS